MKRKVTTIAMVMVTSAKIVVTTNDIISDNIKASKVTIKTQRYLLFIISSKEKNQWLIDIINFGT